MQYANSHLMIFSDDVQKVIEQFSLNSDGLLIESFSPEENAIVVENINEKKFRLHLDLSEDRIIAAKQLGVEKSSTHDFDKYIAYMK